VTVHDKAKKVRFDVSGNPETWYIDVPDLGISPGVWPDGVQDVVKFDPNRMSSSDAGKHAALVYKDGSTCGTSFTLRRGTYLTGKATNIGGGKRVVSGKLKRVSFGYPEPIVPLGYRGQKVRVEYKSTVSGKWVSAGTATTKADGTFKLTKKIGKRQWRAVYAGNNASGSRISGVSKA
jgi:hypothetical protein